MAFVDNVPRLTGALAAELTKADLTGLGRVAHTIKGAGIPFAENRVEFHNGQMDQEQFETACASLAGERSGN